MNSFCAVYDEDLCEYAVYRNGDIFCHLNATDFDVFVENFKLEVQILSDDEAEELGYLDY